MDRTEEKERKTKAAADTKEEKVEVNDDSDADDDDDDDDGDDGDDGSDLDARNQYMYELVGVLVHRGTAQSGHYYSFIKDRRDNSGTVLL